MKIMLGLAFLLTLHAPAQTLPAANQQKGSSEIFDPVEQVPTLRKGGNQAALIAMVRRAVVLPVGEPAVGRVYVSFLVNQAGKVEQAKVLKASSVALGKAVVLAVMKLPRLNPGRANGKVVAMGLTLPISFSRKTSPPLP